MQRSFSRSSTPLVQGTPSEWRLSALILMAALSSVSQGCGIMSDVLNRPTSRSAGLPPEPRTSHPSIDRPQTHTLPREIPPIGRIPSSPETEKTAPLAKIPAPPQPTMVETGLASWYGRGFHGKLTASGEVFDQEKFTAAHRSLPWGSRVRVTNLANGKSVEVRINDRGPIGKGRIIDVSRAAARILGIVGAGIASVRVERLSDSEKSNELVLQDR
jgi:rare lipoprotein A